MKNNLFVKMVKVDVIVSSFSANILHKTKIKENIKISTISNSFCNKFIEQDNDKRLLED